MSVTSTEERQGSAHRHRLTVADFHRMVKTGIFVEDNRIELIDGELINMAPIGPKHADLTDYILRYFARQLPDDKIIRIQNLIQLDRYGEVYPDAAIVRNRRYANPHPLPEAVHYTHL